MFHTNGKENKSTTVDLPELRIFVIVIVHYRLPVTGCLATDSSFDYLCYRYFCTTAKSGTCGAPATDRFASRHQHGVRRTELTLLAVVNAVQEVHKHTDRQPDEEP